MTSTNISRASAILLVAGGMVLLFAPDVVLPRIIPGFPPPVPGSDSCSAARGWASRR